MLYLSHPQASCKLHCEHRMKARAPSERLYMIMTVIMYLMTTPGLKPLPTRYAGHQFRSRLEARWAVAFDALSIAWQYEAQGFECSYRLSRCGEGGFPYLPDFWLPELGLYAEVKAALTEPELLRLLDAAASLSTNGGGGCHDNDGHDMLILGDIPVPDAEQGGAGPWVLHMHKGTLVASSWADGVDTPHGVPLAGDYGGDAWDGIRYESDMSWRDAVTLLLAGAPGTPGEWAPAYRAARSARFEHGQHGASGE
jgi:hypothetical protein